MLRFLSLGLLVLTTACSTNRPIKLTAQESQKIRANFRAQEACWNAGDLPCYVSAYKDSPTVQTITRLGITRGKEDILKHYEEYFPKDKMGQLHFDKLQIRKLGDRHAYVVGRFNLNYEDETQPRQGWFSVVMERVGRKWLMISDHS